VAGVEVAGVFLANNSRYNAAMKWLQWNPDRNGWIGAIFALVVSVCAFAWLMIYIPDFQQRRANAGFGPEWDCTAQPKGDPTCIKKPGR